MFLELEGKNTFKDNYFEMLKYRLAFGSLELEGIDGDLADINQSIKIYNQLNAINYIFEKNPKSKMHHSDFTNLLCEVQIM